MAQIATAGYDKRMRATMNLSLPADLKQWVDDEVRAGGFGTASEYLRDLLRRARERKARRALDESLIEALDSGPAAPLTDAVWKNLRKDARTRVAARPSKSKSARR